MLHTLQSIIASLLQDNTNILMPINQAGVAASLNRTSKYGEQNRRALFFFLFKLKERKREVTGTARRSAIPVIGKQGAH